MKESVFEKRFKECLQRCDSLRLKIHGHLGQDSGWPDLYVAHLRWQGFIELKVENGQPRTNQIVVIKSLRRRGVPALVVRCKEYGKGHNNERGDGDIGIDIISCDGAQTVYNFQDMSPMNVINMLIGWTGELKRAGEIGIGDGVGI
jgi:hypothetical protein